MLILNSTELSSKEPYRHRTHIGAMVTSRSLGGVMVSTLTWNERDVGSIRVLGAIYPIFINPVIIFKRLYLIKYLSEYLYYF